MAKQNIIMYDLVTVQNATELWFNAKKALNLAANTEDFNSNRYYLWQIQSNLDRLERCLKLRNYYIEVEKE